MITNFANENKIIHKYGGPTDCRVEMYAGRVAYLVSPGEYTDGTDRQTDGRQTRHYAFH